MSKYSQLKDMNAAQLSQLIKADPNILVDMQKEELLDLSQKLNPYGRSAVFSESDKRVLFSFSNFKQKQLKAMQAISLNMFLNTIIDEVDSWADYSDVDDKDTFKKHLEVFRRHWLTYDKSRHALPLGDVQMPPYDFIERWQRYEDQHIDKVKEQMKKYYFYTPHLQSALQVYGVFDDEKKAREFAEKHSLSVGVDITMGPVNQWIVLRDDEQTLDKTHYVGDENQYIQALLEQTKKEGKIGEDMLKKRIEAQHKKDPKSFDGVKEELNGVMPSMQQINQEFRQRRLDLAGMDDMSHDLLKDLSDAVPIITAQNGSVKKLDI